MENRAVRAYKKMLFFMVIYIALIFVPSYLRDNIMFMVGNLAMCVFNTFDIYGVPLDRKARIGMIVVDIVMSLLFFTLFMSTGLWFNSIFYVVLLISALSFTIQGRNIYMHQYL